MPKRPRDVCGFDHGRNLTGVLAGLAAVIVILGIAYLALLGLVELLALVAEGVRVALGWLTGGPG